MSQAYHQEQFIKMVCEALAYVFNLEKGAAFAAALIISVSPCSLQPAIIST